MNSFDKCLHTNTNEQHFDRYMYLSKLVTIYVRYNKIDIKTK